MMHCCKCGHEIPATERYCPSCGAAQNESTVKGDVVLQVERAMQGDHSAWPEIYDRTYRYVYFLAYKTLQSEDDAQVATQKAYKQAVRSIGRLYSAEGFYGWLGDIVFSKCNGLTKKKNPMLLSDGADGDVGTNGQREIFDAFIPDAALSDNEIQRIALGLVDALPYAQRQAVVFHCFDGMDVDQIASLAACTPRTVKSRLNHAFKLIRAGLEEHGHTGAKLYGASSLPIMSILLNGQAETFPVPHSVSGGFAPILGRAQNKPILASIPLFAKAVAGAVFGIALIGGSIALLVNNPSAENVSDQTSAPVAADGGTQPGGAVEPSDGMEQTTGYDSLDSHIKGLLYNVVEDMRRSDYMSAYEQQKDDALKELFMGIPIGGGFWYYPSDDVSVRVERGLDGVNCIFVFQGSGSGGEGEGDCYLNILDESKWIHIFAETEYSGGVANNLFVGHIIDYLYDTEKMYTQSGSLINGKAHGAIYEEKDGLVTEIDKPAWVDMWPDWPTR